MAPLAPNNTARLWVDYNDGTNDHTILFRHLDSVTPETVMDVAAAFFGAIEAQMYHFTIIGARIAASGVDVSIPTTWGGAAEYGVGVQPAVSSPLELNWLGRTSGGRMAKWYMYGYKFAVPEPYRFFPGDNTDLDGGMTILRTAAFAGSLVAIDGLAPSVYPYINIQWNSYWETQRRR